MPQRTASILGLALAFALGCLAAKSGPELEVAYARAAEGTTRWEYRCVASGFVGLDPVKANQLGRDGWEMVAATEAEWCFKRPLP